MNNSLCFVALILTLVVVVTGERHHDLHRALKHHSSLEGAAHRGDSHKTDSWIVKPTESHPDMAQQLVNTINRHLSAGTLRVERSTRTGFWVLAASTQVNPDELTALLMSEQRSGTIVWFHRDGLASRKSH